MLHLEKAPYGWKMSPPELPMPMITPNALQLMATTEFANLNSVHSLNSHLSALIDMSHLSHLEDVLHIDSSASNYIIRDQNNFSDYYLSSSKQKIWTGGRLVAIEGYGSVAMNFITRNGNCIPIILFNV